MKTQATRKHRCLTYTFYFVTGLTPVLCRGKRKRPASKGQSRWRTMGQREESLDCAIRLHQRFKTGKTYICRNPNDFLTDAKFVHIETLNEIKSTEVCKYMNLNGL
jgi:hypothetical protein